MNMRDCLHKCYFPSIVCILHTILSPHEIVSLIIVRYLYSFKQILIFMITTVVKFLLIFLRQLLTAKIKNLKNIFDVLLIGETDSPSVTSELQCLL